MSYRVELETRARKELLSLPRNVAGDLIEVLEDLKKNPRPPAARKLVGEDGWRVRKNAYRILYTIDDPAKLIRIYRIGHRREVYRR